MWLTEDFRLRYLQFLSIIFFLKLLINTFLYERNLQKWQKKNNLKIKKSLSQTKLFIAAFRDGCCCYEFRLSVAITLKWKHLSKSKVWSKKDGTMLHLVYQNKIKWMSIFITLKINTTKKLTLSLRILMLRFN